MNQLNLITKTYNRQARLYPALLLIAPIVVTVVSLFPVKILEIKSVVASVGGIGGAFLLTQLARDAGKKREPLLFNIWGGMPSVSIFRHRDTRLDSITKARYHKLLSTQVNGTKAPTIEEEQENPASADETYKAWSHYLRVNARDTKKFSLLFHENISYGYRRNTWGLRPIGITISLLCTLSSGARLWHIYNTTGQLGQEIMGALGLSTLFVVLWLFRFTMDWVRVPADAYAERLAESVEIICKSSDAKKKERTATSSLPKTPSGGSGLR